MSVIGEREEGGRVKAHFLKELLGLPQNERITDSVEPVLPDHPLLRHFRVERIHVDVRRCASRMERRIEVRDIDCLRKLLRGQLDQRQPCRIMPTEEEESR